MNFKNIIFLFIFTSIVFFLNKQKYTINNFLNLNKNIKQNLIKINSLCKKEYTNKNTSYKFSHNYKSKKINFKTDLYSGKIDLNGANLTEVKLLKSDVNNLPHFIIKNKLFNILNKTNIYFEGKDLPGQNDRFQYIKNKEHENMDQTKLSFVWEKNGVKVTKNYIFNKNNYNINVNININNETNKEIKFYTYTDIYLNKTKHKKTLFNNFSEEKLYVNDLKKSDDLLKTKNKYARYSIISKNFWIAIVEHYFLYAWISEDFKDSTNIISISRMKKFLYHILIKNKKIINEYKDININTILYIGPIQYEKLKSTGFNLETLENYGSFKLISKLILNFSKQINNSVNNWGWSIIILTLLIKIIFLPLSIAEHKSVLRLKKYDTQIKLLKKKYKNDINELQIHLVKFYKKKSINPFYGAISAILQIPIFMSLYTVITSSVEIKDSPWILWIHNLSEQDPYFILPIIITLLSIIQNIFSSDSPTQLYSKIFSLLTTLVFSLMFFFLPSGLVLYYLTNNIISILQNLFIIYFIKE